MIFKSLGAALLVTATLVVGGPETASARAPDVANEWSAQARAIGGDVEMNALVRRRGLCLYRHHGRRAVFVSCRRRIGVVLRPHFGRGYRYGLHRRRVQEREVRRDERSMRRHDVGVMHRNRITRPYAGGTQRAIRPNGAGFGRAYDDGGVGGNRRMNSPGPRFSGAERNRPVGGIGAGGGIRANQGGANAGATMSGGIRVGGPGGAGGPNMGGGARAGGNMGGGHMGGAGAGGGHMGGGIGVGH